MGIQKGVRADNKIIGNSSKAVSYYVSHLGLSPRTAFLERGPGPRGRTKRNGGEKTKEKKEEETRESERIGRARRNVWGSCREREESEREKEGGKGTIKTHLYAGQFVITILVGAGP